MDHGAWEGYISESQKIIDLTNRVSRLEKIVEQLEMERKKREIRQRAEKWMGH